MSIKRLLFATLILLTLVGCGSQSPSQLDSSSVSDLSHVFRTYNETPVPSLTQQAAACEVARSQTQHIQPFVATGRAANRREVKLLNGVRAKALAGFRDCLNAAQTLNYPLMVQAQAELLDANTLLAKARR